MLDEYEHGTLKETTLNSIAGSGSYQFRRKCIQGVRLSKGYCIIICSEYCAECVFK